MITKSKVLVLTILIALIGLIVWFLLDEHIAIARREARRITTSYGFLVIGVDVSYTPMGYFRSYGITPRSFNIQMATEIAARLGMRVAINTSSWDGLFAGIDADRPVPNRFDLIISSVTITPERQSAYNFSKPYLANPLVMVTLKDSPVTARSPMEASGLNLAFQADTTAEFFMERLAVEKGLQHIPHRHDHIQYSFAELEQGRLDAVITDFLIARNFIAPTSSPFEITWKSPEPKLFGIGMEKGNDRLTEAINMVLEDMFNDGTMRIISMDTLGVDLVTQAWQAW